MTERKIEKRTVIVALLVLAVVALGVVCLHMAAKAADKEKDAAETVRVVYYTPTDTIVGPELAPGSRVALLQPEEIEGYTFIGWRKTDGRLETETEIAVHEDVSYAAVYSISLQTDRHIVYLDTVNGLFRPEDALTRAEAAVLFYRLMDTDRKGTAAFEDLTETDDCFDAAATLKDLGLITGNYFHPNDKISRAEFLDLLASFFPVAHEQVEFSDMDSTNPSYPSFCLAVQNGWLECGGEANPDGDLSRRETAMMIGKALNRHGDSREDSQLVGTFLDVPPDDEAFWEIADATIEHEYDRESGREVWTKAEKLPEITPGFFYVDMALHYIDESRKPAVSTTACGLDFNEKGEVTSGNADLDELVRATLKEIVTPDPRNENQHDMLREIYDYVAAPGKFHYMTRNYYDPGDVSWVTDEAIIMFDTKKGNCYNYAAVFYELARAIGYDAEIVSGTIGPDYRPHSWVQIEMDGQLYMYDPEEQHAHEDRNCFERDEKFLGQYSYRENGHIKK